VAAVAVDVVAVDVVAAGRGAADVRCAVGDAAARVLGDGCGVLDCADARGVGVVIRTRLGEVATDGPAARLIGRYAGRFSRAASVEALDDPTAGRLAACPIPTATVAQPATATDAKHVDRTRATDMLPVCQV
jgi:hypothetical protein